MVKELNKYVLVDKYILPEIGEYKINEITPLQLQKFFATLGDKENFNLTGKVSDKSVYRVYKTMRNMFNKWNKELEVYYGILNKDVTLIEEVNKLEWVAINDNFFDVNKKLV